MKNGITIATFISGEEEINYNFITLTEHIRNIVGYETQAIIYSDHTIKDLPNCIETVITPQYTKYKRIKDLIKRAGNNKIFCIDADVKINYEALTEFVNVCISSDYALAWGKIESIYDNTLVSALVCIDKLLSHYWIRPYLWSHHIGISLPGQVFMMDKSYFTNKLNVPDTVFDDLTLGIVSQIYGFPVHYSDLVLGCETPKGTFGDLILQRRRWAKGYAESLYYYKNTEVFYLILIHGFAYHLLWIPIWFLMVSVALYHYPLTIALCVLSAIAIVKKQIGYIFFVFLYYMIFPFIHLIWLKEAFINYWKMDDR